MYVDHVSRGPNFATNENGLAWPQATDEVQPNGTPPSDEAESIKIGPMKIALVTIAGLVGLGGCAAPIKDSTTTPSVRQSASNSANHRDLQKANQQLRSDDGHHKEGLVLTPDLLNPPDMEPDAVVTLDPRSGTLTPAMDAQLAIIADELIKNDQLLVRLESYVPSGGSPALEIGIADKSLRKVREHLVSQGVSPRRMLFGNFGGEYSKERDSRRHWVELYLVRRGY